MFVINETKKEMLNSLVESGKNCLITGPTGTGKTTLLKKLINESGKKTLVIEPDGMEWDEIPELNFNTLENFFSIDRGIKGRIIAPEP